MMIPISRKCPKIAQILKINIDLRVLLYMTAEEKKSEKSKKREI